MGGALKTRYIAANVTTPAGGTIANPTTTNVVLGDLILVSIHLLIPAGHAGFTGWRVDYSGVTIVPYSNPSAWIIGDDDRQDFEVDYEVGNTLKIVTYNTDVYDHTHYATLKVTDLAEQPAGAVRLVPVTA